MFLFAELTDIQGGWLEFPDPWGWLSASMMIPIDVMGGKLTNLGFTWAKDDMYVPEDIKPLLPTDVVPDHVAKGFDMVRRRRRRRRWRRGLKISSGLDTSQCVESDICVWLFSHKLVERKKVFKQRCFFLFLDKLRQH